MSDIAVYVNGASELCNFFDAERFLIFRRERSGWKTVDEIGFEGVTRSSPALTRKNTESLLPLIKDCETLAGGGIAGIPFSVFNRAGFRIFEISAFGDEVFDGIVSDIQDDLNAQAEREKAVADAGPAETSQPGVYTLDLISLQRKFPEITSKMAMRDFLENAAFEELRLTCRHIPPWIELDGRYVINIQNDESGAVNAVITRRK
jgi:hypothetical protein